MATVNGYTAEYMEEINDASVIDGNVVGNDLILVTRGGTEINAGNVRGPTGSTGPSGDPPPGTMYAWLGTNAPANHVLMYGQTIAGAQTTYPVLWANLDATFKSGSNLIVPDLRGRIVMGKDNMGGVTANRITSAICGINGTLLGANGGNQSMQQHNHGTGQSIFGPGDYGWNLGGAALITTTTNAGAGFSQNVQPSIVLNVILKVQ